MARVEKERAFKAQQILDNEIYQESIKIIQDQLVEAWQNTAVSQQEEREKIYQMLLATKQVVSYFEKVLTTGKMAEMQELENG
ncbi:hypothetical protein [Pseudoalteromonas lipolytica]|uniref:hypothetical protein n=1 Tax=Pseudoalteromonas lipolytica TaxID=570156 RepID=UPI000EBDC902|nr:hypothetical protein [Pseudoalteromonas lipolytica]HAG28805.1 hypothetical protein [Alteromonas macleodii]|tara:strand:- start:5752 stop:6000 length:249 start_codon:yes stop_codon:yes gene_type:complete